MKNRSKRDITDCSELPRVKTTRAQTELILANMKQRQLGPFIPECDLTTTRFIEAWLCLHGAQLVVEAGATEAPSRGMIAKVLSSWGLERRDIQYRSDRQGKLVRYSVYLLRHVWAWKYAYPRFLMRHMILASPEHREIMWMIYKRKVQSRPFPTWRDVVPPCLL